MRRMQRLQKMQKARKRIWCIVMAGCLAAGLAPVLPGEYGTAEAAAKAKNINLNIGGSIAGIHNPGQPDSVDDEWGDGYGSYVYFGQFPQETADETQLSPIKWRVLQANGGNDSSYTDGDGNPVNEQYAMFLLSDKVLDEQEFNIELRNAHNGQNGFNSPVEISWTEWDGSDLQGWLNSGTFDPSSSGIDDGFFKTAFSAGEVPTVLTTIRTGKTEEYIDSPKNPYGPMPIEQFHLDSPDLKDQIFALSAWEANTAAYGFKTVSTLLLENETTILNATPYLIDKMGLSTLSSVNWHLRSAASVPFDLGTGCVTDFGDLNTFAYYVDIGAAPAFNLNLKSVLFASAASGGKVSGSVGADALRAVPNSTGDEWKLTLKSPDHESFKATVNGGNSVKTGAGKSVEVSYDGAMNGVANEYVSAMIVDSSGTVLYYGNIAQNSRSGKTRLNIPADIAPGTYTLKLFSEQLNGDYETDYASNMVDITLEIIPSSHATGQSTAQMQDNAPDDLQGGSAGIWCAVGILIAAATYLTAVVRRRKEF